MKTIIRDITPIILLFVYGILAGGSFDSKDLGMGVLIIIISIVVTFTLAFIIKNISNAGISKAGLLEATEQFGDYTEKIEYDLGKFILYDETTHRILLKDSIIDNRKIKEIETTEIEPKSITEYREEEVTKTSAGSAVGRSLLGAVIAGPVGAVVGGLSAKKKVEKKEVPIHTSTVPGEYKIKVYDEEGKLRASLTSHTENNYQDAAFFLRSMISANTVDERLALQEEENKKEKQISSANTANLVVGTNVKDIQDFLINSTFEKTVNTVEYELCSLAVKTINKSWGVTLSVVKISLYDEIVCKIHCQSRPYTAVSFNNILDETKKLSELYENKYGNPDHVTQNISYTSLTEDDNVINGYLWELTTSHKVKIEIIYKQGKYYYLLLEKMDC